eukprot:355626-Chlamydomonas_euryale.AAC.2
MRSGVPDVVYVVGGPCGWGVMWLGVHAVGGLCGWGFMRLGVYAVGGLCGWGLCGGGIWAKEGGASDRAHGCGGQTSGPLVDVHNLPGHVWLARPCRQCMARKIMQAMYGPQGHAGNVWPARPCRQCMARKTMQWVGGWMAGNQRAFPACLLTALEVHQVSALRREQVSRVRVCVEEAMVEQLPQRALDAHIDKVDDRQPGRRHCCFVGQLHALDPLHAEHTPAREVPVDARRTHTRHVGVELRKPLAVPALHAKKGKSA